MSNIDMNKDLNKDLKGKNEKFIRKNEMSRENVNALPIMKVMLIRNDKYNSFSVKFDLAPYFSISQRISNSDYNIALTENKTSLSFNKVSWNVHYRLLKGKQRDGVNYWYGVELYISTNCRLSFFLKDRDLLALKTMGVELNFKEVLIDDKEFGVVEIEN